MKKSLLIVSMLLSIGANLYAEVDLGKSETVDKIGLAGLIPAKSKLNEDAAGRWYLKNVLYKKYNQVRNDEFELNDAISSAYSEFINKIDSSKSILGETTSLASRSTFLKYNFKEGYFPIKEIINDKTYFTVYGHDVIGNGSYNLKVFFDNTNPEHARLSLKKNIAKAFLKSRKDRWGRVNKRIILKYYFTIKEIKPTYSPKNINSCDENFNDCDILKGEIIGHITKLEIIDPTNNKVLQTYTDYK
jgi:hypothetical protein